MKKLEAFALSKFHDLFIELYSKRKVHKQAKQEEDWSNNDFVYNYHDSIALSNVADITDDESELLVNYIPSIKMSRFFTLMIDQFDCHVEGGKGSEVKIWRDGSKIFTIGRHKKDQKIPSWLVKNILTRIGIDRVSWLSTLKGK